MKDLKILTGMLNEFLEDENITPEKLQEASESLMPNLAVALNNLFRDTTSRDQIEVPRELFENVFHFFSAMRLCPEVFERMSKENCLKYYSEMAEIYNKINP